MTPITTILAADLSAGNFSIVRFYERRARRILPALFVVLLACLPFAWVLMMPGHLKDFAKSLIAVCVFVSNIYFWRSSGYFDADAEGKPLLHTWSLAVEEQYYVVFPILLLLLWRFGRRPTFYLICLSAAASLLLSEWGWRHVPSANFYLAPSRAWELLAGSICALWPFGKAHADHVRAGPAPAARAAAGAEPAVGPTVMGNPGTVSRANDPLAALGLAMIVFAVFFFDERTPFPSVYALVPVVGTALVLVFATGTTWTARLLSLRPFVWIGLVSYSAYLWHQPMFAFARHYLMGPMPVSLGLALSALAIGFAYLSYRFVEQPFRKPAVAGGFGRGKIFVFSAIGLAAFGAVGAYGVVTNGGMYRFYDTPERAQFTRHFENGSPGLAYMEREKIFAQWRYDCDFYNLAADRAGALTRIPKPAIPSSCFVRAAPHAVFLWGDSHAMALRPGLTHAVPSDWEILQVASSACPAEIVLSADRSDYCRFANYTALRAIATAKPDAVVIAQKDGHTLKAMYALRRQLEALGIRKIVFVGPSPHWRYDLPSLILRTAWKDTPRYMATGLEPDVLDRDRALKRNFKSDRYSRYVSLIDLFCTSRGCMTI